MLVLHLGQTTCSLSCISKNQQHRGTLGNCHMILKLQRSPSNQWQLDPNGLGKSTLLLAIPPYEHTIFERPALSPTLRREQNALASQLQTSNLIFSLLGSQAIMALFIVPVYYKKRDQWVRELQGDLIKKHRRRTPIYMRDASVYFSEPTSSSTATGYLKGAIYMWEASVYLFETASSSTATGYPGGIPICEWNHFHSRTWINDS